jgi:hypothetical protein
MTGRLRYGLLTVGRRLYLVQALRKVGFSPTTERPADLPTDEQKHAIILSYARLHDLRVFVETGTFFGDTVAAAMGHFDRIYSIELSDTLYQKAAQRFADEATVTLLHGDSYFELASLVKTLDQPALFWLDAHVSGVWIETSHGKTAAPADQELRAVLEAPHRNVVLIDDARLMGTVKGFPSTASLQQIAESHGASFEIADDIIRISPAEGSAPPLSRPSG